MSVSATNDKKIIVLCTSRIYDFQVHDYIVKLIDKLKHENCVLFIFTVNSDFYWDEDHLPAETAVFDFIPYEITDAIIIMDEKIKSHTVAESIISKAKESNTPVVIVDGTYEGYPSIKFDYYKGFENVVRHAMSMRPVKKPHIIAGFRDNYFSNERIEAFKNVIHEFGIEFTDDMVSYGNFWAMPAIEAAQKLISSGNIPDCIFCANDIMAINVCNEFITAGYRIPEDIMITGFDGYDEVFYTRPMITTARCTTPFLADATADAVIELINSDKISGEGSDASSSRKIDLSRTVVPTLSENESTGCAPTYISNVTMLKQFNNSFYRHQDDVRVMHEIITRMQSSKNTRELASHLRTAVIHDEDVMKYMSFILNKKCFDNDNYFFEDDSPVKPSDYCLVYDSEGEADIFTYETNSTLINPKTPEYESILNPEFPIIFNALDYMNKPMGYICYYYPNFDISRYSRTANITNTINIGIGGYINMSYQHNLAKKINDMYKIDSLTGLYNRIGFNNEFESIRKKESNYGQPITVIMSDLDGLKYINDNYGHAEGDNAISVAAKALKYACPEDSLSVRFGGDELFSVIIGPCDANSIIRKIEEYLTEYNKTSKKEYSVISSCGFNVSILNKEFDIKDALRYADEQMYIIKRRHNH